MKQDFISVDRLAFFVKAITLRGARGLFTASLTHSDGLGTTNPLSNYYVCLRSYLIVTKFF